MHGVDSGAAFAAALVMYVLLLLHVLWSSAPRVRLHLGAFAGRLLRRPPR